MSILSAAKFLAEISVKITKLRRKLQVAGDVMPPEEVERTLEAIRTLEVEWCSREHLLERNEELLAAFDELVCSSNRLKASSLF